MMENLFWLSMTCGTNGYGFTATFDVLLDAIKHEWNEDEMNEVKEWALTSKIGDTFNKYAKYGMNIENLGKV